MLPIDTAVTFFLASILLALAPGPDNIFVLTQSALRGRLAGLAVTLGLCTGLVVHTSGRGLRRRRYLPDLHRCLHRSEVPRCLLSSLSRLEGLPGIGSLSCRRKTFRSLALAKLYRRGIIMNISNPKVSIFFLAFLPQFADPTRGPLTVQLILLGGIFIIATILVFGGIALLAGTLGELAQSLCKNPADHEPDDRWNFCRSRAEASDNPTVIHHFFQYQYDRKLNRKGEAVCLNFKTLR